jgi:hypothetical protein
MQERRDRALAGTSDDTDWCWVKETYSRELLGFDAVEDGEQAFYSWLEQKSKTVPKEERKNDVFVSTVALETS